jgi:uncharacterized protein (TIRG00374 family)
LKKLLITLLKIVGSLAILGWLFWDALRTKNGFNAFGMMIHQPKQWDLLFAAWALVTAAVVLTLIRWCYLVRAVGISFRMKDALRIGFLGFLFNLSPLGIVGGDLLKAVMLSHEHPGNRAKALASVIIDRIVGLYVLFVVASAGILLTGFYWQTTVPGVHLVCQVTLAATVVGTAGIALVLASNVLESRWVRGWSRWPRIGPAVGSLIDAMRIYHRNRAVLLASAVMTIGVHCLLTISIYLVARGLPAEQHLPLSTNFVVYPISSVASTIPLPAGPFEAVYVKLCTHIDPSREISQSQALIVALVFRLISVLLAAIGYCYYLGARREVAEVMHEVEEEEAEGHSPWSEAAEPKGPSPSPSGRGLG